MRARPLDFSEDWCYVFLMREPFDKIPDVRDGLTREERVVLYVLHETQKERGHRTCHMEVATDRVREASRALAPDSPVPGEGRNPNSPARRTILPTAMLWGRVCEHFYVSPEDLSIMLARLCARK
jgi:hypothetical protein